MVKHGIIFVALALLVSGCSEGETAWVSGVATYAGEDITDGALRFFPLEDMSGKGAGARIKQGRYEITQSIAQEKDLIAGKYRVSVTATRKTGRKVRHPEGQKTMVDEISMYIPPKYNMQSQLIVELKAGENQCNLALEP